MNSMVNGTTISSLKMRQLFLLASLANLKQVMLCPRQKFDENIHVTIRTKVIPEDRSEKGHAPDIRLRLPMPSIKWLFSVAFPPSFYPFVAFYRYSVSDPFPYPSCPYLPFVLLLPFSLIFLPLLRRCVVNADH